jgi:uncharacterized coiled-coil protein SlyX
MKNSHPRINLTSLLAAACLVLAPAAPAVSPPPDGGYANENTAEGQDALFSLTSGSFNTAIGFQALHANTTGSSNTATGDAALVNNTTGMRNTAVGPHALYLNTTGLANTAIGAYSMINNTSGGFNTTLGSDSLQNNTTGAGNTAVGYQTLIGNTTGISNTANGDEALSVNTTGGFNTAIGAGALSANTTGNTNIAIGFNAGFNFTTGSNNIDIGNGGAPTDSGVIRLGTGGTHTAAFIAGIAGTPLRGAPVAITSDGQLGVRASSARFKEEIKPMGKASEVILALKPVSFRYKKAIDPDGLREFGLVAEQVEKIDPDLVARDDLGMPYTVRYEEVNAMLLNEFLKEHRKVADQGDQITELKATVAELKSILKAQAAQIQKVSDQLRTQSLAPRVVANN